MAMVKDTSPINVVAPEAVTITQEFIYRMREELRADFDQKIAATLEIVSTRLNAIEKAADVSSENYNRVPTLLDREVTRLKESTAQEVTSIQTRINEHERLTSSRFDARAAIGQARESLHNEKFVGIQLQFHERDVRTDQDKLAATTAVNAALQAQKEAAGAQNIANAVSITKSENGFTKEIDGLKLLITSARDGLTNQFNDLTGRVTRAEGSLVGRHENQTETRLTIGSVIGVLGGVVGVLALAATVIFGVVTTINKNSSNIGALSAYDQQKPSRLYQ